jgi:hypothetical protein
VPGKSRVRLQVPPQPDDEVVHRSRLGVGADIPDLLQDLPLGDHAPRVLHEELQEHRLQQRELVDVLAGPDLEGLEVDLGFSDLRLLDVAGVATVPARPVAAAQQPLHPREQHGQVEGLGQVVVGPRLQAVHDVGGQALGRQHQDRHEVAGLPCAIGDGEAVDARQHDVEDHEVIARRPAGGEMGEGLGAVAHHVHLVAFELEVELHALGEVLLVFDDEQPSHGRGKADRRRRGRRPRLRSRPAA